MFPYPDHAPAERGQLRIGSAITRHVGIQLVLPPGFVFPRGRAMFRTPMPETTVDHDRHAGLREEDVGAALACTKKRYVHAIALAATMKLPTQR